MELSWRAQAEHLVDWGLLRGLLVPPAQRAPRAFRQGMSAILDDAPPRIEHSGDMPGESIQGSGRMCRSADRPGKRNSKRCSSCNLKRA